MREVYREEADDASEDFKGLAMLNIQPANESNFIRCLPALEKEIGEKPAKLLLQLEFWIRTSTTAEIEGKRWTYQSTPDIQAKAFVSWSQSTINRVIKKLEALELIFIDKFNKTKYDKTRWFALNPAGIGRLKSIILVADDLRSTQDDARSNQNDLRSTQNDARSNQNGGTIPETPTEITSETPTEKTPAAAEAAGGAAAIQTPAPIQTALIEDAKTPVMPAPQIGAHVIPESPTQHAAHTPSPLVPVVPPSPANEDCDDDLQLFFNGSTAAEVGALVKEYGRERIMAVIAEVRLDTNARVPPALVIHKLRSGARAAWQWPKTRAVETSNYSGGKYAAFIQD